MLQNSHILGVEISDSFVWSRVNVFFQRHDYSLALDVLVAYVLYREKKPYIRKEFGMSTEMNTEECIGQAIALWKKRFAEGRPDNPKLLWECIADAFKKSWEEVRDDDTPHMRAIRARVLMARRPSVLV